MTDNPEAKTPKIEFRRGGYFVCFASGWSGPWRTQRAAELAREGDYLAAHAEERRDREQARTVPGGLEKLRSDVFAVLRRHDVSEQCFAEVAMITQAALSTQPLLPDDEMIEAVALALAEAHDSRNKSKHGRDAVIAYKAGSTAVGYWNHLAAAAIRARATLAGEGE